jgi:hypothetical protein
MLRINRNAIFLIQHSLGLSIKLSFTLVSESYLRIKFVYTMLLDFTFWRSRYHFPAGLTVSHQLSIGHTNTNVIVGVCLYGRVYTNHLYKHQASYASECTVFRRRGIRRHQYMLFHRLTMTPSEKIYNHGSLHCLILREL